MGRSYRENVSTRSTRSRLPGNILTRLMYSEKNPKEPKRKTLEGQERSILRELNSREILQQTWFQW